jgi:hypothetical protein
LVVIPRLVRGISKMHGERSRNKSGMTMNKSGMTMNKSGMTLNKSGMALK